MPHRELAIIGGGPKAAAIAAKASVLKELANIDIRVTIFEKSALAAAWDGAHGFTDGNQRTCTVVERDIGFPYEHEEFGPEIVSAMQERFSWQAYAVATTQYEDWVNKGRRRISHGIFASYITECLKKSGAEIVISDVKKLRPHGWKWNIDLASSATTVRQHPKEFDGVVVTGTGPASNKFYKGSHTQILDGISFWRMADAVPSLIQSSENPIVILGSGGTAAAVAAKLHRMKVGRPIVMIGSQPALFARVDSVFENRLFRDTDIWVTLSHEQRKAFTDRLTSGAVWSNVLEELADADLLYRPGRVKGIIFDPPGATDAEMMVEFKVSAEPMSPWYQPASLIIDATGFNSTWFCDLLPDNFASLIRGNISKMRSDMDNSLKLPVSDLPNLHVPGLSQTVQPAFSSLMALGALSTAILKPYLIELM